MPAAFTYPGVYIDEIPTGGARPITAVPTSITAFVGTAGRGPTDGPRHVSSLGDFQRLYGTADTRWPMTIAVEQFYLNGGSEAEIVRIAPNDAAPSTVTLPNGPTLTASSSGTWGDSLRVRVTHDPADANSYDLVIRDTASRVEEAYAGISIIDGSPLRPEQVLRSSALVRLTAGGELRPDDNAEIVPGTDPFADTPRLADPQDPRPPYATFAGGSAGTAANLDYGDEGAASGMYQLLRTDLFNLLCVLPPALDADVPDAAVMEAAALAQRERAFYIVDHPRGWATLDDAIAGFDGHILTGTEASGNVAIYFPRTRIPSPDDPTGSVEPPNSGAVAGIYARVDATRRVWKSPAGLEAGISGARELTVKLTDLEHGRLNRIGVNGLRQFPGAGRVVWGARTMRGGERILEDPSRRYIAVRRTTLMIEESLYRGTQFAVFEPNDEPLWSQVRLSVGGFMDTLFRQGAFQGSTPDDAYLVKCDADNNPQADIDRGILNILVGFAPLKPAEFVYIRLQQLAGQAQV